VTIDWPAAVLIMFLVFVVLVGASEPSRRQHEARMAEIKARANEEYRALAGRYDALEQQTHDELASMQADLAAVRTSVESIEAMMRAVS
jgi:hypothetical protein